ncbi:MAG: TIGR02302 family protein [Roseicyclus sp.]|uniref:TIGR02302 family protein n=1 Tax=Roseicyclus sp. TaxID=1914329 RepID=UPI003A8A9A6C
MTEPQATEKVLSRLIWPLRLTRAGMVAERVTRAFWPVWSVMFMTVAAFAFGIAGRMGQTTLWAGLGLVGLILALLIARAVMRFRMPSRAEAMDRLDRTLPGRPLSALLDHPAMGAADPATQSVWAAHLRRMADRAATARAPEPDLRLSRQDPFALRYVAATALAMALLFGTMDRVGEMGEAVSFGTGPAIASGPSWEGWVEPPVYTGLPSLYLNEIFADGFETPVGSRITFRSYGEEGSVSITTDVGPLPSDAADSYAQSVTVERSGDFTVNGPMGRSWSISVLPDQAPAVALDGEVEGEPPGQMQFSFTATDDYGVTSGTATIRLDASAADRRFGLSVEPEPREALVLDLPMPFRGSRSEFTEVVLEDLSQHPFANLPVTMTLTVTDAAGQIGTIAHDVPRLPGRRFFDPLANAVIEMRRDLLWSRENAPRAAQILRALTQSPEPGLDQGVYLQLRSAIRRLEAAPDMISTDTRDQVAEILWNAAMELEVGDLDDALERLRQAQERLSEAMRQGASDEEIAQLMDELRQAMDDYMQQLAENAQPGEDRPDDGGERMEMSMSDLEEMMRRIEELMQEGRMAEAQEMLNALQQMLENMEMVQGGEGGDGPRTPGEQAMEGLQDTLRDQQQLSDDAFRELQDRLNPGRPQQGQPQGQGQPGQDNPEGQAENGQQPGTQQEPGTGQGGENGEGMTLAERQEALRRMLEQQQGGLPGSGTEAGDEALRRLDDAARAMEEAEGLLEQDDLAGALDAQSEALEALREGMTELGRALAQDQTGEDPGQGMADGNMAPDRPLQDPLGRQAGNSGAFGSDEAMADREEAFRRSRELLDELRRRSAEQERPELERDYLRRLLDQF